MNHIRIIAKYESMLLMRSWFFRIFAAAAVIFVSIWNMGGVTVEGMGGNLWSIRAIPSNISYMSLYFLNIGQSIVAIFLAADFMKRERKLDTSEVLLVRPVSNAAYILGKIWGNMRVFIFLNAVIICISIFFTLMSGDTHPDMAAYIVYFFIISVPSLVYIIGLSVFLMLVIRNQALTFIVLLGYAGTVLFYAGDRFNCVLDYPVFNLPLVRSEIAGFTDMYMIVMQRAIYLFAGMAFVCFTVALFNRLPSRLHRNRAWIIPGVCLLAAGGGAACVHVTATVEKSSIRAAYIETNNRYADEPRMAVDHYDISVTQNGDALLAEAVMTGTAQQAAATFTFCLNPGLQVDDVFSTGLAVAGFRRDHQMISVTFRDTVMKDDTVAVTIRYSGRIDSRFCYLDVPEEEMNRIQKVQILNVDRQFAFQKDDYLLLTPETCWYPRAGITYSDTDVSWMQQHFSMFTLSVKPAEGLTPLSAGDGVEDDNGCFTFRPDFPVKGMPLVIGRYLCRSAVADGMQYRVWYVEGHDWFTAAFDSITDSIPSLAEDVKEQLEGSYRMDYPFNSFSVIETPAQFYAFTRTWANVNETVHPGIVLFPEKGWTMNDMDVSRRVNLYKRLAKNTGVDITDVDAQIRAFSTAVQIFTVAKGNRSYFKTGRGTYGVSRMANPFFQFPQLYSFHYNVCSDSWPVANRTVELYLQGKEDMDDMERDINGITGSEKSNMLIEKHSFAELPGMAEHRDLVDDIIHLHAGRLFAAAEMNAGTGAFRDSVLAVMKRNAFRNVSFEALIDTLGAMSNTDIRRGIAAWMEPVRLPAYSIGVPDVARVVNSGQEQYVMKLTVSNISDNDGIVRVHIDTEGIPDPRADRLVSVAAHTGRQLVSIWDHVPGSVTVNTMISANLPAVITQQVRDIRQERSHLPLRDADLTVPESSLDVWGEIIVDNEDSLFTLSKPAVTGLLPMWLDRAETSSFKYSGSLWGHHAQWTATTSPGYYGRNIRSAHIIRSGSGSQTATWNIPVPVAGRYDAYYYMHKTEEMKNSNREDVAYRFRVVYDGNGEDAYINIRDAGDGWEMLGSYWLNADTVRITLTNDFPLRLVTADAVKIVRRQDE